MEKANKEICSLVPAWSRLTHQTATLHYAAGGSSFTILPWYMSLSYNYFLMVKLLTLTIQCRNTTIQHLPLVVKTSITFFTTK